MMVFCIKVINACIGSITFSQCQLSLLLDCKLVQPLTINRTRPILRLPRFARSVNASPDVSLCSFSMHIS